MLPGWKATCFGVAAVSSHPGKGSGRVAAACSVVCAMGLYPALCFITIVLGAYHASRASKGRFSRQDLKHWQDANTAAPGGMSGAG